MKTEHLHPPAVADQCEHLGIEFDAATYLADASPWNYCHRAVPAASVQLAHQTRYCLTDSHVQCAVFRAAEVGSLPSELRGIPPPAASRRPIGALILVLLASLGVMVGLAAFLGVPPLLKTETPQLAYDPVSAAPLTASPGSFISTATATSSLLLPVVPPLAATVAMPTDSSSVGAAAELSPSVMPPNPTVAKACGHQLDEPFGVGRKFVIHRVQYGDSLEGYEASYQTSRAAIEGVNAQIVVPLRQDQIIVIPVNQKAIDEVPQFDAYQIWERDTTVGKVASMLKSTSLNDFLLYNGISTTCPRFSGWVLVPRERPSP